MSTSKIKWGWNVYHKCKITNPKKKNFGKTVFLTKGLNNDVFFMNEKDTDEPDYTYHSEDFEVIDINEVNVNVIDDGYWQRLRNETATKLLVDIVRVARETGNYSVLDWDVYVAQAVNLSDSLIEQLKNNPVV